MREGRRVCAREEEHAEEEHVQEKGERESRGVSKGARKQKRNQEIESESNKGVTMREGGGEVCKRGKKRQ